MRSQIDLTTCPPGGFVERPGVRLYAVRVYNHAFQRVPNVPHSVTSKQRGRAVVVELFRRIFGRVARPQVHGPSEWAAESRRGDRLFITQLNNDVEVIPPSPAEPFHTLAFHLIRPGGCVPPPWQPARALVAMSGHPAVLDPHLLT